MSDYSFARSADAAGESQSTEAVSGSAVAGYVFAGVLLIMAGTFQAIAGLAAILEDEFFVKTPNYAFEVDVTAWGWIHLLVGLLVVFAGYALFAAKMWARVTAVTLATLSAIANFVFIPSYPVWATLIIALDVWVIWALTRSVASAEELAT